MMAEATTINFLELEILGKNSFVKPEIFKAEMKSFLFFFWLLFQSFFFAGNEGDWRLKEI